MSRGDFRKLARTLAQPVTYLGLGMLAVIWCALGYLLTADRNTDYEQAKRRAENLARIFEQSFSNIFQDADARLLFLRKVYARNVANFDLALWVRDPSVRNSPMIDFAVLDAIGRVVHSTYSRNVLGQDRSDRDYFRAHHSSARDELYISEPFTALPSGRKLIVLSRRITAADGAFAGVVTAALSPSLLGQQATDLDLGLDGAITLLGLDGVVRVRATNGKFDWGSIGRRLPLAAGTLAHLNGAKSGAFWNGTSIVDNITRLVAFRQLEAVPMIATVGISETEVYRRANDNARTYAAIAILLSLATLAAIAMGAKRERKLIAATSEMKAAQEALQQSQERYWLVEDAVNDGIWDRNLVTAEVYLSSRWKTIMGYADDDLSVDESSFLQLIHPDDRPAVVDARRAHLEEEKPYALDFRLRRKNGEYVWVRSRGKVLRDATSRPVRMVGTITDISERKKADALIEESRNNLARAEAMALLGHYKYEFASSVHTWSEGAYHIFAKLPEAFNPAPDAILDLIHPDDRSILQQHRRDLREGLNPPPITVRAFKDDGQMIYVQSWSAPVRDSDGSIIGAFGTLQDVTARQQAKEALARSNQELEARVAERTAELACEMYRREQAQMSLAQVQKMEAVGQLTAGIAHDFNNLLAVIRGGLEFIDGAAARGLTADPELIDASLRATRRGSDLVQRLLAFSRQSPLRAEPTLINQLVLDTLRLLQRTLGERVDIVTRLDAAAAVVRVDRSQLANALVNLALNARDAMPEGGELTIATVCQPARWAPDEGTARWPTGEEVCIVVSDTGVGMSEQTRSRAFEPFFTTKPDGLGSGLGLSMVHGFVEQSGGHIEIDSEFERGTAITIRLPRIETVCPADETRAVAAAAPEDQEKTVLLVEDDPDVRIVTAAQLRHLGYRVHAVANGIEALDLIESPASIDITLTDIVLPGGIDGVALVKEAMRARPQMGVLCMSGYDPTQKHRKWLMVQNIAFLEKPFSCGRLAEALEDAVAR